MGSGAGHHAAERAAGGPRGAAAAGRQVCGPRAAMTGLLQTEPLHRASKIFTGAAAGRVHSNTQIALPMAAREGSRPIHRPGPKHAPAKHMKPQVSGRAAVHQSHGEIVPGILHEPTNRRLGITAAPVAPVWRAWRALFATPRAPPARISESSQRLCRMWEETWYRIALP